ncbi:spore germination protein GerM [Desulfitispora alkaliphila]|uniref:GerMN domain-containing protein n=1 Tax=Desulfitispora alkaliphila TaxID=622674 RepID=UPI003D22394E
MKDLSKNKVLLLLLMISMILFASGCGLVDRLVSMKQDGEDQPEISVEQESTELELEEWILQDDEDEGEAEQTEEMKVTLYFADAKGQHLVEKERTINKVEGIGRATVNELIKGPSFESGLLPTMPDNTVLLDINVKQDEGLAIVDFSRALVDNHIGGSSGEAVTVYSVVNTLTQFPAVDKVQIIVDGQYVETIAGHLDVSEPLTANSRLINN